MTIFDFLIEDSLTMEVQVTSFYSPGTDKEKCAGREETGNALVGGREQRRNGYFKNLQQENMPLRSILSTRVSRKTDGLNWLMIASNFQFFILNFEPSISA
jgi:hypothetical protein